MVVESRRRGIGTHWRIVGAGIALVGSLVLAAGRGKAKRQARQDAVAEPERRVVPPLPERFLPHYDATILRQTLVHAPPEVTCAAISEADLMDPVVRALFSAREEPARFLSRFHGDGLSGRGGGLRRDSDPLRPLLGVSGVPDRVDPLARHPTRAPGPRRAWGTGVPHLDASCRPEPTFPTGAEGTRRWPGRR